jgi:phytoene/squalene synthetase
MRSGDFYQRHLDAVSRSFALCIPQLDQPFRERVALSYLLLRVLDTVEDAPFHDRQLQQRQFEAFRRFVRMPPARAQVDVFRASFLDQITDGERNLLADTQAFLEDAHQLPAGARGVIFSAIERMAQGMAAYQLRPVPLRLIDLEDVTRYCCIVAGLVGELLTRLWALGGESPPRMIFAYRFGLFLQKVNILKDRAERGYRTFCAWSLMLGASSLSSMEGPRESHRAQTLTLLARTAAIAQDNEALRRQFAELLPRLPELRPRAPVAKPESAERFVQILDAPLSESELLDLGAVSSTVRRAAAANQ